MIRAFNSAALLFSFMLFFSVIMSGADVSAEPQRQDQMQ
jgi:hypothetical protein